MSQMCYVLAAITDFLKISPSFVLKYLQNIISKRQILQFLTNFWPIFDRYVT